jgi:uncharacterized protein involved in exopolysaccharide biosynthesis
VPQDQTAPPGALGQLATQFGLSLGRSTTASPAFYADLLQSRGLLRSVLLTRYTLGGERPFDGTLLDYLRVRAPTIEERTFIGIKRLRSDLSVSFDARTAIVRFAVATSNPELSARIVNRMIELLNEYNLRSRQAQGRAEREFVEQQLEPLHRELVAAEEALVAFSARNRVISAPELRAEESRLERQVQLRQQLYIGLAQSLAAARIEEVRNTPVVTVIEQPEGLVEPLRRHTVRKTLIAFVAAGMLVAAYIMGRDAAGRAGSESPGLAEFMATVRSALPKRRGGETG